MAIIIPQGWGHKRSSPRHFNNVAGNLGLGTQDLRILFSGGSAEVQQGGR